ncbi:MAG: sugar transferase [Primorskyibacter sp.]
MDLFLAVLIAPFVVPAIAVIAAIIWFGDRGSPLYPNERMAKLDKPFHHLKFRTMRPDASDSGVSGGDKSDRITPIGHILRRTRLDELPQWWNVVRGDMSFVGPRPPLRLYAERFPELYQEVLRDKPGITGMATLVYHKTEERLLAQCTTAQQTDTVYARHCVPRKAQIDILYAKRRTVCSDLRLVLATVIRRLPPH